MISDPSLKSFPQSLTEFLLAVAAAGGACLLLCIGAAVSIWPHQQIGQWIIYLSTFTIAPTAGALLALWAKGPWRYLLTAGTGLGVQVIIIWAIVQPVLLRASLFLPEPTGISMAVISGLALAATILALAVKSPQWSGEDILPAACRGLLFTLPVSLAIFLFLYSGWDRPLSRDGLVYQPFLDPRFGFYLIVAVGISILLWVAGRAEDRFVRGREQAHRLVAAVSLAILLVLVALLFNDGLWVDMIHYRTVVEPAAHLLAGGRMLVDVFSQYGLMPFLLVAAGFKLVGENYAVAAFVSQITCVLYLATAVVITFLLTKRKIVSGVIIFFGLILHITYYPVSIWIAPSVGGFRYLVPMMMPIAIYRLRENRHHSFLTLALLALSSFFELVTFVYTLAAYLAFIIGSAMWSRDYLRGLRDIAIVVLAVVATQAVFALWLFASAGSLPRYDYYFGMLFAYSSGEAGWAALSSHYYWVWMANVVAYAPILALVFYAAFERDGLGARIRAAEPWLLRGLLPVVTLGVLFASYYAGRSTSTSLYLAQIPLFVTVVVIIDRCILSGGETFRGKATIGSVLFIGVAIVIGFGASNFLQPYDVRKGNATVLRECISVASCDPERLLATLQQRLSDKTAAANGFARESYELSLQHWMTPQWAALLNDSVQLIRRYAPDSKALVLLDSDIYEPLNGIVLIGTGKWNRWPLTSAYIDSLSPGLTRAIVAANVTLAEGEAVIARSDERKLLPIEQDVLAQIRSRYRLCLVEQTESGVAVLRVHQLSEQCPAMPPVGPALRQ